MCGSVAQRTGIISKSGFHYGKFANNMFSILKLLLTVPKMAKKPLLSNMKIWDKMAIFETTAKNSVLGRWVHCTHLQYEKKMKKFDLVRICPKIMKFRYFCEKLRFFFSTKIFILNFFYHHSRLLFGFLLSHYVHSSSNQTKVST